MKSNRRHALFQAHAGQQRAADAIVKKVIGIQSRWAQFLQRKTAQLPKRLQQFMVVFLFFSGLSYNFYLIASGLTGKYETAIHIQFIHLPAVATDKINSNALRAETEFTKINAFRRYMDSLQKTASGKTIADSILAARPGLPDSIQQLEQLYHSINTIK